MQKDNEYTIIMYQNFEKQPFDEEREWWSYAIHNGDGSKPGSLIRASTAANFNEVTRQASIVIKAKKADQYKVYDK